MTRIQEFDSLRTLAVMIVITDHYAPFRDFANGAPAKHSGLGVDIFFVLSGYLITNILLRLKTTERPYQVFYAARFLRILPPYFLLLLLVYGIGALLDEPLSKGKLIGQLLFLRAFKNESAVLAHTWAVLRGASPVPGMFHKIVGAPPPRDYPWLPMSGSLGPTWSLSVEEWFYVLWAPVVLMFRRRIILLAAAAVCLMSFLLRWLGGGGSDFFSSIDILIVGAVLAMWMEHRPTCSANLRRRLDRAIGFASLLSFILLVGLTWIQRDLISRTLIEVVVFGALAWIIDHAGRPHPICRALRFKPLVYLGTISYMIYLIHLPMYFLVRSALHGVTSGWSETARMWIVALCSLSATIAFSALSWKYYEHPILGFKESLTHRIQSVDRPAETAATRGDLTVVLHGEAG